MSTIEDFEDAPVGATARDVAGDYTVGDISRFGAVWVGINEFRRGLENLNKSQMSVATVKECVNIILRQFPEGFVDSVKAYEERNSK